MAIPTWNDIYRQWLPQHMAQFGGQDINRAWNTDADSRAQKLALDQQYLSLLADYNKANGTNEKPDASVLGVDAQPNKFTPTDHSHDGFFGGVAKALGMDTNTFGALAAIGLGGYGLYSNGALSGLGAAGTGGADAAIELGAGGTGAEGWFGSLGSGTYGLDTSLTTGAYPGSVLAADSVIAPTTMDTIMGGAGVTGTLGGATDATGALIGAGTAAEGAASMAGGVGLLSELKDAATGVGSFLKDTGVLPILGGLVGAAASQDKTNTATSTKDPWGPAQPYLLQNLQRNQAMSDYYNANPFSNEQKLAYQNLANTIANGNANMPGLLANAAAFGQSRHGVMPAMTGLISGTQAPQIDWSQYANIGKK